MSARGPFAARWILERIAPPEDAPFLVDDLAEQYGEQRDNAGPARAWGWYWSQTLRSLPPLVGLRLRNRRRRLAAERRAREGDVAKDLWLQDVGYALRRARSNALVSTAVIATMALGVGATTAIFTVARDVVFDPLPFPDPHELVSLQNRQWRAVSIVDVRDRASLSRTLESIAASNGASLTLTGHGDPQRLDAALVSERFADTVGIVPALGRHFRPEEHVAGGRRVVMLTYGLWQRQFGGDPSVIGRTLRLEDEPYEVIGVLPPLRFDYPSRRQELWLPLIPIPDSWQTSPGSNWLMAVARLRAGVTLAEAQAEMDALTPGLVAKYGLEGERDLDVVPLQDAVVGPIRPVVLLLGSIVLLVLLIACSNIANLLLADAEGRRREFAIRAALGGRGRRLARQVLVESLLLALTGGALAVVVARGMVSGLLALYPGELPRAGEVQVDWGVLVVAFGATLVAGLLAGQPSVLQALRADVGRDVREGERGARSPAGQRARTLLVAGQVALSVLLLVGAGLLLKSFWNLVRVDPGYRSESVLTFNVSVPWSRYDSDEEVIAFYDRLLEAVGALPGVRSAGAALGVPMTWGGWTNRLILEDEPESAENGPFAEVRIISPGYLETMGIPLREGRAFTAQDRADTPRVVLVNARAVKEAFRGRSPLGRRISWDGQVREVVGVVGDVRQHSLTEPAPVEVYSPATQIVRLARYVAVRAAGDHGALVAAVRGEVARLDSTVAVSDVATMDERLVEARAPARFRATLTGALGALALLLAMLGIYGSMAYAVRRQTRDIGIRLALGAAPAVVRRGVIGHALAVAGAGAGLGVAGALATSHLLAAFFFEVGARDAFVLAGAPLLLLAVALAAAYAPARWASRVDPARAMRAD